MRKLSTLFLALLALLLVAAPATAQDATTTPEATEEPLLAPGPDDVIDPNVNISWPPPVYVVRGEYNIRGSANLPDLVSYFLEFRALDEDMTVADEEIPWIPVSIPSTEAVSNDVLAVWDTTTAPDGLYELRLTATGSAGEPVEFVVRPVRVENEPPPFVELEEDEPAEEPEAPAATATPAPTEPPPPTPTPDNTPRITVTVPNANVRSGDSTAYGIVTSLPEGTTAPIIGISSFNTGWFLIQTPGGQRGWIAPSIVSVSGNTGGLPRVAPPPPPATPTPTPIPATPTPATQANLVAGLIYLDPNPPTCGQTFNVAVDLANLGSEATGSTGVFTVEDIVNGAVQGSTQGPIPIINAGQTVKSANIPLTINTFFNETHTIRVTLNPGGSIAETTNSDNVSTISYTLQQGACG